MPSDDKVGFSGPGLFSFLAERMGSLLQGEDGGIYESVHMSHKLIR
jgi:hypothetical protein